ncbi:FAD:protein FMN transferase [Microbacterium aurum]|uniref:FAD:protein FMN transferase n=1 Tax=Microbacterium aurum TaxID=36805 RepID=UPI000A040537|nr:FAD:protein FMN transferase [Microbacterium aurum]MBM7827778.1 thiamine biosynthesis lipoprotein [Microbacterium aurum]
MPAAGRPVVAGAAGASAAGAAAEVAAAGARSPPARSAVERPRERWEFAAIGTVWRIDTAAPLDAATRAAVTALIDAFDRDWSRFRPDSLVTRLAAGGTADAPTADAVPMLDLFAAASAATDGAVNPLIGDALARRGYDAGYGFVDRGAQPAPAAWRDLLRWDDGILSLCAPATIDVGALGKGRLVDLVLAEVRRRVVGAVTVEASGDIAVAGATERIALEHPYDPTRAIGVWEVTDAALCASATGRRAWPGADGAGLHHVLDARTGEPVRTIAATWALAADAITADAVATTLFFDGGPRFAAERDAQWVRMTTDGRVEWSPGSTAELFL